ncbi:hypothetical protein IAD21_02524 [Abditibacteriota bacterium]|nr:hypothetical protein IAD21_02524 [Abditibacteriota bacterium]
MNNGWKPLPPQPDVKAALDEFASWGAVVEHYLFVAPAPVDICAHQLAEQSGLNTLMDQCIFQGWAGAEEDVSKLTPERARPMTLLQFFGEHFDFSDQNRLVHFPHPPFPSIDEVKNNAHLSSEEVSPFYEDYEFTSGYAYALLDPPYGLNRRTAWWRRKQPLLPLEIGTAFLRLCDALFGARETLQIYDWPTDCSNYFEPGHEWWGSFFWTVYSPSKNWIVTIIASTTD